MGRAAETLEFISSIHARSSGVWLIIFSNDILIIFLWSLVDRLRIHYIHIQPSPQINEKIVLPLLLLHSWPGSVREFFDLIPHLVGPNDEVYFDFKIIIPSLPGSGWSDGTLKKGLDISKMAVILMNFMYRLGCGKFIVHGNSLGGVVGSHLASLYPNNVLAFYSTMCLTHSWKSMIKWAIASICPSMFIPSEFVNFSFPVSDKLTRLLQDIGHVHLLATQPEIIATMVATHPIALAAYILGEFERLTPGIDKNALIDNLMIYYLNGNFAAAARVFAEERNSRSEVLEMPTSVPAGCARFRADGLHMIDWQLTNKFTNLIHSSYHQSGGDHAAFGAAKIAYDDFVEFTKKYVGLFDWDKMFAENARK